MDSQRQCVKVVIGGHSHPAPGCGLLVVRQRLENAPSVVGFNATNDFVGCDQVHATWQPAYDIDTKAVALITFFAVPQRLCAIFPTGSLGATGEGSVEMNELVTRIGFPVGRLSPAGDYNAGPDSGLPGFSLNCGRQMHQGGDRTKHSLGVIDQTNELSERGVPAQIDHPFQLGVMMPALTYLDKLDFPSKMVHDRLVTSRFPPFYGYIIFSACGHNPKGRVLFG